MRARDAQGPQPRGQRGAPPRPDGATDAGRDGVLAKKRARLALIDRLDRHTVSRPASRGGSPAGVSAIRLLAEVDLALSEHRD
jgi:hypothetical protein